MTDQEEVFFEGTAQIPLKVLVVDVLFCLVVVGLFKLLADWLTYRSWKLKLTSRKIVVQRGIVTQTTEALDLFRVRDLQLRTTFGRSALVVYSTDATTPVLELPFAAAAEVFERLQNAVSDAQRRAGVRMIEPV
jgi:hypothetical protein